VASTRSYSAIIPCLVFGLISASRCVADQVERIAIAAHQDEIQNLIVRCEETRHYNIDPAVANRTPLAAHPQFDLVRTEMSNLTFSFLNGNARYDRMTDQATLKYWVSKQLPAIVNQIETISADGRVEQLTTQQLVNGKRLSFGGFKQLDRFSPDDAIDIALGLRLLGARQWLTKQELNAMQEVPQPDQSIVDLQAQDGNGHIHELRFDRRFLYALVYYRCSSANGASVEIKNSDFHEYGNVFIPGKIVRTSNLRSTNGEIHHPLVFSYVVTGASVNDENNNASRYVITFPANLLLFDARTNDQIKVGPIARTFSDDDIHRQIAENQARQAMFEQLAERRINQALTAPPSTQP
jgi:hypothetical protein